MLPPIGHPFWNHASADAQRDAAQMEREMWHLMTLVRVLPVEERSEPVRVARQMNRELRGVLRRAHFYARMARGIGEAP